MKKKKKETFESWADRNNYVFTDPKYDEPIGRVAIRFFIKKLAENTAKAARKAGFNVEIVKTEMYHCVVEVEKK